MTYHDQWKALSSRIRGLMQAGQLHAQFLAVRSVQRWTNDDSKTVQQVLTDQIATIGEKMWIATFARMTISGAGRIGSYVHSNGKIGVLVGVNCESDRVTENERFRTFLKDLSMHITAYDPQAMTSDSLDPAVVAKEREILLGSDDVLKKPENIREKIVDGKIAKFYKEVCLLQQGWVKEDKKSVESIVAELSSTLGENVSIEKYARVELGQAS